MCRTLIYIGGDYREETQKIIEKYDNQTSLAALVYEQKIHSGLEQNYDRIFNLLVAMVSWFPKRSRLFINKTVKIDNGYSVGFNNLIGVRDYSIYFSLKKYFKKIIKQNKLKNEPFDVFFTTQYFYNAKLGKYIKKKYPAARIVYDIQDGPGLISKKYKGLTKALKNYQQKTLIKNMTVSADGYVVMTPYMTELFDSKNAEVLVIEGATEKNNIDRPVVPQVITYTGGIYDEYFPYDLLSQSAKILKKKYPSFRINVAGRGDEEIMKKLKEDRGFFFMGMVTPEMTRRLIKRSNILFNLRQNNDVYKYSFPSKTFEYLASGNPIISTNLGCYSEKFKNTLFIIEDLNVDSFVAMVDKILNMNEEELAKVRNKNLALSEEYSPKNVGLKIKNLFNTIRNKTN